MLDSRITFPHNGNIFSDPSSADHPYFLPPIGIARTDSIRCFIRAEAHEENKTRYEKIYPCATTSLPKDKKREERPRLPLRYYKPPLSPLLCNREYPGRRSASIRDSPRRTRFCLICALRRGLPDTRPLAPSSSPLSRRRRANTHGDFAIPPVFLFSRRIRRRVPSPPAPLPPVYPLAVPRKKRGNHFGILSGITSGRARRATRGR